MRNSELRFNVNCGNCENSEGLEFKEVLSVEIVNNQMVTKIKALCPNCGNYTCVYVTSDITSIEGC